MLFRCSKCGKFRKYGTWVDVPQKLLTQIQNVPISYILCQGCEKEAENSQLFVHTDGGGVHESFAKGNCNHKKEGCHRNNGNEGYTIGVRSCSCGSH